MARRTRWKRTRTERTAATTWGSSRLSPWRPNSQVLAAWMQKPSGGLSTETKPPGSYEAKKKVCQVVSMVPTVAA